MNQTEKKSEHANFDNTVEIKRHISEIRKIFGESPVWKIVLKMALPATLLYLTIGLYNFADSVLAVLLAPKNYSEQAAATGYTAASLVRLYVQTTLPISLLMNAISTFFGVGVATRVSINIGNGKIDKALNALKAGTTFAMIFSIIAMILLIVVSPSWTSSQVPAALRPFVVPEAFTYAWILLLGLPFTTYNSIASNIFRSEGKNRIVLIAGILPIFLNLFMDWIFMGPLSMGIGGASLATTIAYFINSGILIFGMFWDKKTVLTLHSMFGFQSVRWIALFAIALIGFAPFLRLLANAITQTAQLGFVQHVSSDVYSRQGYFKALAQLSFQAFGIDPTNTTAVETFRQHYNNLMTPFGDAPLTTQGAINFINSAKQIAGANKNISEAFFLNYYSTNFMTIMTSGAFPIYALFVPALFGFADAGRPIIAYNYGAKNYKRIKQTFIYTTVISFMTAVVLYFISTFALGKPLLELLDFRGYELDRTANVLKIYMLILPVLSISVSGILLLGATDRISLSIIASSLQGLILLFPTIIAYRYMAINYSSSEYLFWWYSPTNGFLTSLTIFCFSLFTLHRIKTHNSTLEEKISKMYDWAANLGKKRTKC